MLILFGGRQLVSLLPELIIEKSIEVMENKVSIEEAVSKVKRASHYEYSVFDVDMFEDDTEKILKELYGYKASTNAKIVIVAFGRMRGDPLLSGLIEMGIYDFVTSLDLTLQHKQMHNCIKGREYSDITEYLPLQEEKPKNSFKLFHSKPKKPAIVIALAGIIKRMGTTTQAVRLVRHFSSPNSKSCYVEANDSVHVKTIAKVFSDVRTQGDGYVMRNIMLYPNGIDAPASEYDYIIIDCGCDITSSAFLQADIKVIVAGSAAWEMSGLAKTMSELNGIPAKYIFVFTGEEEREDILEFMGERWTDTCFAEHVTDMFSELTSEEKVIYTKLFKERGKLK